jgi:hypothetical protein
MKKLSSTPQTALYWTSAQVYLMCTTSADLVLLPHLEVYEEGYVHRNQKGKVAVKSLQQYLVYGKYHNLHVM